MADMTEFRDLHTIDVLGQRVFFTRRRYGPRHQPQFYCWAHVEIDGQWYTCGDPYPAATFRRKDLEQAVSLVVEAIHTPDAERTNWQLMMVRNPSTRIA